ncbi:MAG: hypothetical protein DI573_08690 [Microbacterium sp.]|uniref:hypothetical protein n=1 Tax=Microbacterium sp. TaxID=51671 RepID=UPI000DB8A5C1|nr:hypothetical protein [Microbacterium sp.]PZU38884.1 MAG: hypothetical protein DI573_08690 [Microbacterium sp.]
MIFAGLLLLAIGAADLARRAPVPLARRVGLAALAVAILVLGALTNAPLPALVAVALAAEWVWLMPAGRAAKAGVWPAIAVLAACAIGVASIPPRADPGVIGEIWLLPSPAGEVSFDLVVLVAGALVFLAESANIVVRAALRGEFALPPVPSARAERGVGVTADAGAAAATDPVPLAAQPSLKGGRLIGPLERVIVFSLTLAGAYTLLAAVLAAKGIVRFPEISRDDNGDRAEYFLVGSLVSWSLALALAGLVWWGGASPHLG